MRVQHDSEAQEFSIPLESGKAYLRYDQPDERTFDLLHTIVPPEEQSRGVGSDLIEHVFRHVRDEDKRIVPSCPFVRAWLEDHPEYQDVVR